MVRSLPFLLIIFVFTSCSSGPSGSTQDTPENDTLPTNVRAEADPAVTVIAFLKWYRDNALRLAKIPMVKNEAFKKGDTTKYYRVNFENTENYLAELKASGFISEKYISQWREYFKACDVDFQKQPEYDGPPAGFDYDFISFSQEDIGFDELDKVKVVVQRLTEDKASLRIKFKWADLDFILYNEGGKWLIDDIQNKTGE